MKTDWQSFPLEEGLTGIIDYRGKTPPKVPTGIPTLTAGNVKSGRIDLSSVSYVSNETYERWTTRGFPKAGDVLITTEAPVGQVAPFPTDQTYLITRRVIALQPDPDRLDSDYLLYYLLNPATIASLLDRSRGSTVPRVLKTDITRMEVTAPKQVENQKAIAQILKSFDDKIELNRRMNRTLEEMAQAIFKSWFVDFEPVRAKDAAKTAGATPAAIERAAMAAIAGRSIEEAIAQEGYFDDLTPSNRESLAQTAALFPDIFQDSELGEIPEEWSAPLLGSICDRIFSGGTPRTKTTEFWGGEIPWLSSGETGTRFITATEKTITERGVESSSTREARSGSIVIASAGQGKTRGQTSFLGFDSYINQSVIALEADQQKITDSYLFFNLAPRYEQLRQLSDAHSSRGSLTTKLLAGIQTIVPEPALIREFDNIAAPMIQQILANDRESRTLANLRDALLPKLLNGEIRPE